MATKPRSELVTMTQSVPEIGPNGTATPSEIAWGQSKRGPCKTPARMREMALHLLTYRDWGKAKRTGATLDELERAGRLLVREADRWEAESLIDCT